MNFRLLKIITTAIITGLLFINFNVAMAEDNKQNKSENQRQIIFLNKDGKTSKSLFTIDDGSVYPDYVTSKSFYIKNTGNFDFLVDYLKLTMSLKRTTGEACEPYSTEYKNFIKYMNIRIKSEDDVLYEGSFDELIKNNCRVNKRTEVTSKKDKEFNVTLWMDSSAGNELEELQCKFDINFLFSSVGGVSETNLPRTGSPLDNGTLFIVGSVLIIAGAGVLIINYRGYRIK